MFWVLKKPNSDLNIRNLLKKLYVPVCIKVNYYSI